MPNAPLRYCLSSGCVERVRSGYCERHQDQTSDAQRQSLDPRYGTQRWRRYSRRRLAEHPFCVDCGRLGEVTDHILPVRTHPELFFEESNHATRCQSCNRAKRERPGGV